jgi:hypothetical protein
MQKVCCFIFILFFISSNVLAYSETLSGISKIYIEYENGQNQVIELPNKVNYQYSTDESGRSLSGSEASLLPSGQLNQNLKISRIALYMDGFIPGNSDEISINGYFGFIDGDTPTGYSTITNWQNGIVTNVNGETADITNFHFGVVDFNSSTTYSSANNGTVTISNGDAFDAANKSVKLRFKQLAPLFGGEIQTQDL